MKYETKYTARFPAFSEVSLIGAPIQHGVGRATAGAGFSYCFEGCTVTLAWRSGPFKGTEQGVIHTLFTKAPSIEAERH